jgi:hypothetical protein
MSSASESSKVALNAISASEEKARETKTSVRWTNCSREIQLLAKVVLYPDKDAKNSVIVHEVPLWFEPGNWEMGFNKIFPSAELQTITNESQATHFGSLQTMLRPSRSAKGAKELIILCGIVAEVTPPRITLSLRKP